MPFQKRQAMDARDDQPLRPTQYAENRIIRSILNHTYPPNSNLPGERELAHQIGVTRPTLRETLQRLAKEGWIRIRHGKPTRVNDYWRQGGLGMLGTMALYVDFLPDDFILNLLEVRAAILPVCSRTAAENAHERLLKLLKKAPRTEDTADFFASFDWRLQQLMVLNSGNCIYPLIFNDFENMYNRLAGRYFTYDAARKSTADYYQRLTHALTANAADVAGVVETAMKESIKIWLDIGSHTPKERTSLE